MKQTKIKDDPAAKASKAISGIVAIEAKQQTFIADQTRQAKEFLKRVVSDTPFAVIDEQDFLFVNDFLKFVKECKKEIELRRKKITDPLNAALKAFRSWHKPPVQAYEQVEKILKAALVEFELERTRKDEEAMLEVAKASQAEDYDAAHAASLKLSPELKAEGLSITQHYTYRLVDIDKVPRWALALSDSSVKEYIEEAKPNKPKPVPGLEFFKVGRATRR